MSSSTTTSFNLHNVKSSHWSRPILTNTEINALLTINKTAQLPSELNTYFLQKYSTNKYYIEYNSYLSNHVAHGMIALYRLNCPLSTITTYMQWYAEEKNLQTPINYENKNKPISLEPKPVKWTDLLRDNDYGDTLKMGERKNYYGILEMMQTDLQSKYNDNIAALIADRYPTISSGIVASLLHGLIHLGYGISCNNKQIILEGIAYIPHSYVPFYYDQSISRPQNWSIVDVLQYIKKQGELRQFIYKNYYKVINIGLGGGQQPFICLSAKHHYLIRPYVDMFYGTIPLMNVNREENRNIYQREMYQLKRYILSLMITLYAYSKSLDYNDFVLLHGVTSAWSLTQILPFLNNIQDINQSVLNFMMIVVATYVVQLEPDIIDPGKMERDWRMEMALIVMNIKNDTNNKMFYDVHIYKLIAVVLECLEYGMIDEKMAYYAIRKSIKPLVIKTIHHVMQEKKKSKL